MELKLKNTIQDTIDSAIIVRRLSGIEKKTTLRRRIIYVIYLIISSGLLFMTIKSKLLGTSIFTCVLLGQNSSFAIAWRLGKNHC